jgi:hypothetical protein
MGLSQGIQRDPFYDGAFSLARLGNFYQILSVDGCTGMHNQGACGLMHFLCPWLYSVHGCTGMHNQGACGLMHFLCPWLYRYA